MIASQHHLGVVNQVEREQQSAKRSVDRMKDVSRADGGKYTEDYQNTEGNEEHTAASSKIPFCLESENG